MRPLGNATATRIMWRGWWFVTPRLANTLAELDNSACRQLFRSICSWSVDFMEKISAREVILLGSA
jgi:hypothetical protein